MTAIAKPIVWTLTDPDSYQYGRKVGQGKYEFKEFDKINNDLNIEDYGDEKNFIESIFDNNVFWIEEHVDISTATDTEKEYFIKGYYTSLAQLKEICGNDMEQVDWIIAECLFEQNSGLY